MRSPITETPGLFPGTLSAVTESVTTHGEVLCHCDGPQHLGGHLLLGCHGDRDLVGVSRGSTLPRRELINTCTTSAVGSPYPTLRRDVEEWCNSSKADLVSCVQSQTKQLKKQSHNNSVLRASGICLLFLTFN